MIVRNSNVLESTQDIAYGTTCYDDFLRQINNVFWIPLLIHFIRSSLYTLFG